MAETLKRWLVAFTEPTIVIIDAIAYLIIVVATIQLVVRILRRPGAMTGKERREVWLDYARWLVGALTFQLAADIVETSISTSWETIGRLGAVAVIRTFLEYFLGRDVNEIRERQREKRGSAEAGTS
jgi:uncharacterized membrane protein